MPRRLELCHHGSSKAGHPSAASVSAWAGGELIEEGQGVIKMV